MWAWTRFVVELVGWLVIVGGASVWVWCQIDWWRSNWWSFRKPRD